MTERLEEHPFLADEDQVVGDGVPLRTAEHAPGELAVPDGVSVIEGSPVGGRRPVAIVVARFNGEFTSRMLDRAVEELAELGVPAPLVTVMPVPGAFELPLAAMALARRAASRASSRSAASSAGRPRTSSTSPARRRAACSLRVSRRVSRSRSAC